MSSWTFHWNLGMTAGVVLLVAGGVLVVISRDVADPLYMVGVGILTLAMMVYLGSRIWMMMRRRKP